MLWPLVRSFLKLTPFHRRVRWFDALHRETLLSLGQHSGQRYLSWNGATDLLDASRWAAFQDEFFTPVEKIVEVVLMLVEGDDMVDGKGVRISADRAWRWMDAITISGKCQSTAMTKCDRSWMQQMWMAPSKKVMDW